MHGYGSEKQPGRSLYEQGRKVTGQTNEEDCDEGKKYFVESDSLGCVAEIGTPK